MDVPGVEPAARRTGDALTADADRDPAVAQAAIVVGVVPLITLSSIVGLKKRLNAAVRAFSPPA